MEDFPFLSIDEQTVTNKSVNVEQTSSNLQKLQKHIFYPNLLGTMAASESVTLKSGSNSHLGRQESVNDDDLFGDGTLTKESAANDSTPENTDNVDGKGHHVKDEKEEHSGESHGCIPHFGMLGWSSTSESNSENSPKPFIAIEERNKADSKNTTDDAEARSDERNMIDSYGGHEHSDYKLRFLNKRSISADNRRTKFRNSSGGDVFDHFIESIEEGYNVCQHVRKSNSLPDLVLSSSLSPSMSSSNPNLLTDFEENFKKQLEIKQAIEGASSTPAVKKPKVMRTVSIKEEPECITYDVDYQSSEESDNSEDKQPVGIDEPSKPTDKISTHIYEHSTPTDQPITPTEERRRILSSGYGTGVSDTGSQDKSEKGTSRQISQGSSGVWTSQESVDKGDTLYEKAEAEVNDESVKGIDTLCHPLAMVPHVLLCQFNSENEENHSGTYKSSGSEYHNTETNSSSAGSSLHTVVDAKTQQPVMDTRNKQHRPVDVPYLSILQQNPHEEPSFGPLKSNETKQNEQHNDPCTRKKTEHQEPKSLGPQSCGNLPNFLTDDSSFLLNEKSLEKVQKEDQKQYQEFINKYFPRSGDGSFGSLSSDKFNNPSSGNSIISPSSNQARHWEEILLQWVPNCSPTELLHHVQELFLESISPCSPLFVNGAVRNDHKEFSVTELEQASRCNVTGCNELCCLKMQEVNRVLKSDLPDLDTSYDLVMCYCSALSHHYKDCDAVKCTISYCPELQSCKSEFKLEELVMKLQSYTRNPTMNVFLGNAPKFHKLQTSTTRTEMEEFESHIPMFLLGKFGSGVVCMETSSQTLVVIKTYILMDYKHQLSLYTRIRDETHANIIPQLWLLEYMYDEKIQVCSMFAQGGSLKDYLSCTGGLPWAKVVKYMKQMLSAAKFLNKHGIVYLYWRSENMLFCDDRRCTLQVDNFSLSCPRGCELDIGTVKECLPYNICPPELLRDNKVDFKSDMWGAGCIFYELLTGTAVFHDLRHENRRTVYDSMPDTSPFTTEQRTILESCWKVRMEDRCSLRDMLSYLRSFKVR